MLEFYGKALGLHLRIGEHFIHFVNRSARNAAFLEARRPVCAGVLDHRVLHDIEGGFIIIDPPQGWDEP